MALYALLILVTLAFIATVFIEDYLQKRSKRK